MKNILLKIITICLAGLVVFFAYQYIVELKRPPYPRKDPMGMQDRFNRNEELRLKGDIQGKIIEERNAALEKLALSEAKLLECERVVSRLKENLSLSERDNLKLKQDNDNLRIMSERVLRENTDLTMRLNSLEELKKAIRKVKLDIHFKKVQAWLARVKQRKEESNKRLLEGNQGFFMKDGKPQGARLKIKISDAVDK